MTGWETLNTAMKMGLVSLIAGLAGPASADGTREDTEDHLQNQVVATALRAETALDGVERDLKKRVKLWNKRSLRARKALSRRLAREQQWTVGAAFRGEQSAFHGIRRSLARQRQQLAGMKGVEIHGVDSLSRPAKEVSRLATSIERLRTGVAERERESSERWEAIEETGTNPYFQEQKQKEQEAVDILRKLHLQEESLVHYALAVSGSMSLEEGAARSARLLEEQRAQSRRRQLRLEESKKAWLGLLTALGTAALTPEPLSAEEQKRSLASQRERVREYNRHLAAECAGRGGYYFQPSSADSALGTCLAQ